MTTSANASYDASQLPVVPIDAIPVLQFACSPLVGAEGETWPGKLGAAAKTATYSQELKIAKGLDAFDGKIRMGDASYSFRLIEVSLEEKTPGASSWTKVDYLTTPGYAPELPPVAWRKEPNAGNATPNAALELALGTRAPYTFTHALERSTELTTIVSETWKGVCDPIEPPTCVLWTFCGEKLGPSAKGWRRKGTARPDEPGTVRSEEPNVALDIVEPQRSEYEQLIIDAALQNGDVIPVPAQVVGVLGSNAKVYVANLCARGLQIPRLGWMGSGSEVQSTPPGYATILQAMKERLYVDIKIGPTHGARLLLATNSYFRSRAYEVQLLDEQNTVLASYNLWDHARPVASTADLPVAWTDHALPWASSVQSVYKYLTTDQEIRSAGPMHVLLLEVKSEPTPFATLRIRAVPNPEIFQTANLRDYTVLVGIMEACRLDDEWRYEYDYQKQVSEQKEIYDYLNEGERGSLLLPDREYRIGVRYRVYRFDDDSLSPETVRYVHFKTDDALPARLDPFILATYPRQGEPYVFYEDPIQVIFNDSTTLQMYDAYGAKIKFSVHQANGKKFVPWNIGGGLLGQLEAQYPGEGHYQVLYFDLADAELAVDQAVDIGNAYYDTLKDLVATQFKCINGQGLKWKYDKVTIKGDLQPLMAYTLQLFPAPKAAGEEISIKPVVTSASAIKSDGSAPKQITNAGKFLRRFTTSRYRNMREFARDIYGEYVQHRPLQQAISFSNLNPNVPVHTIDDVVFVEELRAAGEDDLTPPRQNRVVLYWAPTQGIYRPHALLVDAIEPLWRDTEVPIYEIVDDSSNDDFVYDPNFKRVVMAKQTTLVVAEEDGVVDKLIHAFGGMRTLALIKADQLPQHTYDPPTLLTLLLKHWGNDIFQFNPATEKLYELALTARAPWEDDRDYA